MITTLAVIITKGLVQSGIIDTANQITINGVFVTVNGEPLTINT